MKALAIALLLSPSLVSAAPYFDAKTPACAVPLFSWTNAPIDNGSVNRYLVEGARGTTELNATTWDPEESGMDLAGKGLYFSADPVSSQSYGNHMIIAWVKPSSPSKDVRRLNALDDEVSLKKSVPSIRSESPLLVHRWISKLGQTDAVVLRSKQDVKAADVPVDLSKSEVVVVNEDEQKDWKDHATALASDTIGQALQKYSDKIRGLLPTWNASEPEPGDALIWAAITTELSRKLGDQVGYFENLHGSLVWYPFEDCSEMSEEELTTALVSMRKEGLVATDFSGKTSCELKSEMTRVFKTSPGYAKYLSLYHRIQDFKRSLALESAPAKNVSAVSTLSAKCR